MPWKPNQNVKYIKVLQTFKTEYMPEEYVKTMEYQKGKDS